jgi:pyruvate/2-oxoglutarate dehydrogenase complex dihydrolipoamide dehydrogenase (E3) component
VFLGEGRFTGRDALEVDGRVLRFRRAVIATGARAAAPPIPGLEDAGYLTNETLFSLAERPRRLAVIGAGPIGCEMSQSFARFGTEVILMDRSDHVLAREDADAAEIVQRSMLEDGVRLELGVEIAGVEVRGGSKVVTLERAGETLEVEADEILVAAGRAANVENLGLDAAGVGYGRKGVEVDDRLRTSNSRIYAAGDVASPYKFTHFADAQARIVVQNALFFGRKKSSDLVVPWVTYTSPEIAHVGLTEDQAREKGIEVDTVTVGLDGVDRAVLDGEAEGFVRLYVRKGKDTVVGATLVAEHAGEMAGELAVIITAGVGLGTVAEVIHPYPTQAEAIKKAADAWRRRKLTPTVKRWFQRWFRLTA